MRKNKLIIKTAKNKEKYVVAKGKNNKTVATTETFKTTQGAKRAAATLKKIVKNAVIIKKKK
jgi:uncharacterized protein YegP (UPF0339 family)